MMGRGLGVRRMTANSMASRTVKINRRTFTNQVSQFRSSEMECIGFGRWSFVFVVDRSQSIARAGLHWPERQRLKTNDQRRVFF